MFYLNLSSSTKDAVTTEEPDASTGYYTFNTFSTQSEDTTTEEQDTTTEEASTSTGYPSTTEYDFTTSGGLSKL